MAKGEGTFTGIYYHKLQGDFFVFLYWCILIIRNSGVQYAFCTCT